MGSSLTHQYDSSALFLHNVGIQWEDSSDLRFGSSMTIGHCKHELSHRLATDLREGQTVDQFSYRLGFGAEYDVAEDTTLASVVDYTYYHNKGGAMQQTLHGTTIARMSIQCSQGVSSTTHSPSACRFAGD
jgi:hypothetical protein